MKGDLEIWEDAAQAWSKDVTKQETFRTVLFGKTIDTLMTDLKGKKILDAGCGDGFFSKRFTEQGAEVTALDGAARMVEYAKQKYPEINFKVHDLLKPFEFSNSTFDIVFANMVLMHLSEIDTFITEAKRVLKPKGKLIFSILHPAFNYPTMILYKSWIAKLLGKQPNGLAKNYYLTETQRRFEKNVEQELTHYHRTLEDYSQKLSAAGFVTKRLLEPHNLPKEFLDKNPKLEYATRLPRFLIIEAISYDI